MTPETKHVRKNRSDEQGFILVTSLLILLVLTIIGIAANRNTSTELLIAGNDRSYKESFYNADGGVEAAQELLEQNIACIPGFPAKNNFPTNPVDYSSLNGGALIDNFAYIPANSLDLWRQFGVPASDPTDANRNILIPWDHTGTDPYTNITMAGDTKLTTGAAIQMAAGYEGKGKGIGQGGAYLVYDIKSQHNGKNNSAALIAIKYRHIIGTEGDCYF